MDTYILPYIDYVNSDKSVYPKACNTINVRTNKKFIDKDKDFLIGNSGGFLMNINFKFIDTQLFSKAAYNYESNIKDPDIISFVNKIDVKKNENRNKYYYCPHLKTSKEYDAFWKRETYRRRNGITAKCKLLKTGEIVSLHITGDHYNYLNYSRINRTLSKDEIIEYHNKGDYKTKLKSGFPRFWDGDYWNFKTDLFIANNNFHLCKGKARGKGYSFKRGSQAANTMNLVPKATVILCADLIDYLTDADATASMVKTNLDWFEMNTHWKRFYLSENLENVELGYRTSTGGNIKKGFLSKLFSISLHNNESGAIGKRALEIDFEESGKLPNLEAALGVTLSSTEVGAGSVGTIRVYGTAGTKLANWQGFANVFFNPAKYKMMPFENIWDNNARHKVCGFFHPQVLNLEGYMDKYGNSLLEEAYKYDIEDKTRQEIELNTSEYIIYVGQRANTPEEAFKSGGENIFSSIELSNHVSRVISDSSISSHRDGMLVEDKKLGLVFKTNLELKNEKITTHPYITDVPFAPKTDIYGCIREYHSPYIEDNIVPSNLYYGVLDPVAKDKKSSLIINKNSLNSINILMFPNNHTNTTGDIVVASYTGRPERMEDSDKILLKLCKYYNAKALVEVDRGETVSNFRKWKELSRLYTDPTIILSNKQRENLNPSYGINMGSGNNAMNGLEYFRDWLYRKRSIDENGNPVYTFHYINDIPLLRELLTFSINGNFDRISSMRVAMFILKAVQVEQKQDMIRASKHNKASVYEQIGLFGYKGYKN